MTARDGFSLDGRELATGRQAPKRRRGGRDRVRPRGAKARVVASGWLARGRTLPRAVVPPAQHGGNWSGLGISGEPLEYRAVTTSSRAAKVACRNSRRTKGARVAWEADFRRMAAAGARR